MPAFGRDGMLKRERDRRRSPTYVRSLSGLPTGRASISRPGKKIFADNCAACHGDEGKGNREVGAPNLADDDLALRL